MGNSFSGYSVLSFPREVNPRNFAGNRPLEGSAQTSECAHPGLDWSALRSLRTCNPHRPGPDRLTHRIWRPLAGHRAGAPSASLQGPLAAGLRYLRRAGRQRLPGSSARADRRRLSVSRVQSANSGYLSPNHCLSLSLNALASSTSSEASDREMLPLRSYAPTLRLFRQLSK